MRSYISSLTCGLLLILLIMQCDKTNEARELVIQNTTALSDSVTYYKNRLNTLTASVKTMQLDKNQLQELVVERNGDLKKITAEFNKLKFVTQYQNRISLDTIGAKFETSILSHTDSTLTIFKEGQIKDKWYSLGYKVTNDSIIITPFSTWTETTVITGFKQKWLLGKQTLTTEITNTNPYISISAIKSIEVVVPEPWYKKWYLWLAAGIAGGILIN